jgi:hypothetical protein
VTLIVTLLVKRVKMGCPPVLTNLDLIDNDNFGPRRIRRGLEELGQCRELMYLNLGGSGIRL